MQQPLQGKAGNLARLLTLNMSGLCPKVCQIIMWPAITKWALTAHNWQKWKRVFLTCPCHKIYRDEAVGLKSCKYTWKITIFVKMCNLGQYRENLIFCQLLNWSLNLEFLLHMCDTYNCDYLKHSTFCFNFINFQLNTDFPSQFCVFYLQITKRHSKIGFSRKCL